MARKSFAKKLSFLLTVSMLASSLSPAVVSAAETDGMAEQIVSETEEAVGTEESETERPDIQDSDMGNQDEAPVPKLPENETRKMRAARVMSDGINDAWDQDKNTIVGTAATNEIYNNIWLHLKADASNGNSHSDASQYPAMFVNPSSFDFSKEGFFSFTTWTGVDPSMNRFGIMLGYNGPGNGMFLGYDADGWFWQKYKGGDGAYFEGDRVESPALQQYVNVTITWTADHKATLKLQNAADYTGTPASGAEEITVFENEDFSGISDVLSDKIALKCAAYGGNTTEVYLSNIHYVDQKEIRDFTVNATVKDESGRPLESAAVELLGTSARTDANGTARLHLTTTAGTYKAEAKKKGFEPVEAEVVLPDEADAEPVSVEIILKEIPPIAAKTLSTNEMDVIVAENFPFAVQYNMKGALEGKTFWGQTEEINTIKINGTAIKVKPENLKTKFTSDTAVYEMALKDDAANIDCVITARLKAEKNTLAFDITKVVNNKYELDEKKQEVYPVQKIEIPNHSLISVRSSQQGANLKGAKTSGHTLISGDQSFAVKNDMTFKSEDFMYGFVSSNELSAGLWSNSEYQGTFVYCNLSTGGGGAANTRVMATATDLGGEMSLGLASTEWYYDRKITPSVNGKVQTYVVKHGEMPSAKVAIAGDMNDDKQIDWQDGAIAFRSIMHNPFKCEEVPELVNQRIAMDFGSQAANPFLTVLDGVKRVYLNTDGLGQSIILKGYGSEGHDSGHPDYGDIGSRIGGAEDMNKLLVEGGRLGAKFGVHINASEMYTEAKAFNDELSRGNYGWNWLDQGIGINGLYDLGSGERMKRLRELKSQVGDNLDFIYLDVWGNNTSGAEDAWESRNIARQINSLGWRFTTEWGATQEYDSTLQHWAADLYYGGQNAKGQNSAVMRFLRNHQKDSWIADYGSYGGAAQAPLLGGLEMTDFEGWQKRTDYRNYITVMFRHNLTTKFLQHYKVMKWVDGNAVTVSDKQWVPEMAITLQSDDKSQTVEVTRDSNDYTNLDGFRGRTIKLNGTIISKGARTSGYGTESNPYIGNETYLVPWYWDADGSTLAEDDQKLYHWNTAGGTTTWELLDDWKDLKNVIVYKLTDEGRTEKTTVAVQDGKITLTAEGEMPYVVYRGEKAPKTVNWQSSKYVYDMGFNDADLTNKRTVSGTGKASVVDNVSENNMLKLEGEVAVTTELTNLKPGQRYALYVGVDNRSDVEARMTVKAGETVLATNYTNRSFVENMVASDQHNTKNGATEKESNTSCFQNMYVFFTAPASGKTTLALSRQAGAGASYFDDVRVVETKMDPVKKVDEDGNIILFQEDFENHAQGIWPFVITGPKDESGTWGAHYYVEDNRIHLSEAHAPYTNAGYKDKRIDDVLDGNWSVKINGLTGNNSVIYQTIPQNFHFEPGEMYYVSFDYQLGSEGTYEVRVGDGKNINVERFSMPAAIGKTKNYGFCFRAPESGQGWIGIYSTNQAADMKEFTGAGDGPVNFCGYKDFILDNLKIQKAGMFLSETSFETSDVNDTLQLSVSFADEADEGKKVTWASLDEDVACVSQDGLVKFTGFGSTMITATADFNGTPVTLSCGVNLIKDYETSATWISVVANTQESAGESGEAYNTIDKNPSTIWHTNYSGAGFTVSESNPAVLTLRTVEDIGTFKNVAFQQRPTGPNGLVQKYECVIGDTYDGAAMTITDGKSIGAVNAVNAGNGQIETMRLPEGASGHYLQIRVLQGYGNFAAIAEVYINTDGTYDTPQAQATLKSHRIDAEEARKESAQAVLDSESATEEEKAAASAQIAEANQAIKDASISMLEAYGELEEEAQAAYDALLADENATEEEKAAAKARLDTAKANIKATQEYLDAIRDLVLAEEVVQNAQKKLDALKASGTATEAQIASAEADLKAAKTLMENKQSVEAIASTLRQTLKLLSDVQLEKESLQSALDKAKSDLKEANTRLTEAAENYAKLEGSMIATSAELQEAKQALETAREDVSALQGEVGSLEGQLTAKTEELSRTETALNETRNSLEALKKQISDLENNNDKLEDNNNNLLDDNTKLEEDKKAMEDAIKKAQDQIAQLQKDLEQARQNQGAGLKAGDEVVYQGVIYSVLDASKKTAAAIGSEKDSAKQLTVAGTVKIKDVTFKVTEIAAGAFRDAKKLNKVTIGANVQKIRKNAFYNAKKLKTIKINSLRLKSVGAKAFAKIHAKAKITVPKSKKTAYSKLLKKKESAISKNVVIK